MLVLIGRIAVALILYVASSFLLRLAMGAAISTRGDAAQAEALLNQGVVLLACAALAAWLAGLLWIGLAVDSIAKRRVSGAAFLALTVVLALPELLSQVVDETWGMSGLRFVTLVPAWVFCAAGRRDNDPTLCSTL